MRVHLIGNPNSGGRTDLDEIRQRLGAAGATLVDDPAGAERIVVSGGDGMIGPAADVAAHRGLPLAVIPSGTANDFAGAHGLPCDVEDAIALAVAGVQTRMHELGRADGVPREPRAPVGRPGPGRPFVNALSAGLSPAAGRRAAPLKRLLGPLAYSAGAVLAGLLDKPLACTVDEHFDGRAWQLIVACTGAFGGGTDLDAADPHDGVLDLFVVPDRGRRALARHALAMRRGTLADLPDVLHARAGVFTVRLAAGTPLNVDGELVKVKTGAVELTIDERPFALVVPER